MAEPTRPTIKRLFALSGNICAFPGCSIPIIESSGTVTGEICHINARSKGGPRYKSSLKIKDRHAFDNLILLCSRHHKTIDTEEKIYTTETLKELKKIHEAAAGRPETTKDNFQAQVLINAYKAIHIAGNTGNISINSPGSIQGNHITVSSPKKSITIAPPPNSLGAHSVYCKYIAYLITRYNQYAKQQPNRKTKFNPGVISNNLESEFGASWKLLEIEYASKVINYLHNRIDRTRIALINKGKGYRAYSTLEQYIQKYGVDSNKLQTI